MEHEHDFKGLMKKAMPPENVIADFIQTDVKNAIKKLTGKK